MPSSDDLTLCLAIDRLTQADSTHYAIWVLESPFPGGYAHHDRLWDGQMAQIWESWQQFFSLRGLPQVPHVPSAYVPQFHLDDLLDRVAPTAEAGGYTGRLMQGLGVSLWEWLFDGPIRQTLERSLGIAIGQNRPLKLRLEVRPPELISLPWEIMQPQPGCPALSLGPQVLFSRTASTVEPLPAAEPDISLRILLVLGQDDPGTSAGDTEQVLQLPQEAEALKQLLELSASRLSYRGASPVVCQVQTLLEPDAKTLLKALETGYFNVFFYAGHGVPAPDGGMLFLRQGGSLSGTELAQGLAHNGIRLAVFNTCWGAQPDLQQQQVIPRSSLAEVLLHHGVPAVLAMRDSIADEEALSFIQVLARGLAERQPVDQAVALARQHLLTAYRFNHPAWTLPVLYQHPQFEGHLLREAALAVTQLPGQDLRMTQSVVLRCLATPSRLWRLYDGYLRVGRLPDNDLVILEPWVSGQHAEIFCRTQFENGAQETYYYLRDRSRYGSYYFDNHSWHHVHRAEVPLALGTAIRFGSPEGELMEFTLEGSPKSSPPC
ncbi:MULTISPECIES: CHAT domain-containing protein [Cyanophyceae]|uniref:CHAT domain-containing protein n=1 Tax=Cyanophyceae TaxID=3028117 RepID=UPI001687276B|nr:MULTISPECIES: CHAT domain-containing protein [Cyanophyceae]MBD1918389.1 CHAT domain-containing protein [Phormidium sp. FACHB-77]MBD2028742.1 CHAT domain-containing protein [Phormidium sp. FACHB-322]MBD2051163.1 CHAT domain-containing protein [Leptolyngbya sp. FACHB-60]